MNITFKILERTQKPDYKSKKKAFLIWDEWNDYSFLTLFHLTYIDEKSTQHNIGDVKIGYFGQSRHDRKLKKGEEFTTLNSEFFSLGQTDEYYVELNKLGEDVRDSILTALNDIAKHPTIYEKAIEEDVTTISLLRSISPKTVTGQFRRISMGGVRLTEYSFSFFPKVKGSSAQMDLSFNVKPESYPPTNIHVLIGRNGVGKTHLINSMVNTLTEVEINSKNYGRFESESDEDNRTLFANLTLVSFSAFDETVPKEERKDKTQGIQFSYIGLKRIETDIDKNLGPKSTTILKNEFFKSLAECKIPPRYSRWKNRIRMLESDPNFKDALIKELIDMDDEKIKESGSDTFKKLSSGHKIVLLTITRLVETLQEKSLVLIDEPEAHLHPPLLSAFIRTLSELLIETNSVAIIATHSPVIIQEVPRDCVWRLRRSGVEAVAERLSIETFGENVGTLTNEIFGLEVTNSGFYKMIVEAINMHKNYDSVIEHFQNKLGMEAKAIIMSMVNKENSDV